MKKFDLFKKNYEQLRKYERFCVEMNIYHGNLPYYNFIFCTLKISYYSNTQIAFANGLIPNNRKTFNPQYPFHRFFFNILQKRTFFLF